MASSRKDKFKKAIKSHIEKTDTEASDKPGMQGFVEDMAKAHKPEEDDSAVVEGQAQARDEAAPVKTSEPAREQAPEARPQADATPPVADTADAVPAPVAPAPPAPETSAPEPKPSPAPRTREPVTRAPAAASKMSGGADENLISRSPSPVETVPEEARAASYSRKPIMARTRDSVYNVSSDIRLEDYTESNPDGGGGVGAALRIGAGLVLLIVLLYGVYSAGSLLFAPSYTLAVASTPLNAANAVEFAASERVSTAAGSPVYIHFQWEEGELATDYVKIQIDRVNPGGGEIEEAILARRPPITANYIQFAGPLEVGKYRITVTDRSGRRLADRMVTVN